MGAGIGHFGRKGSCGGADRVVGQLSAGNVAE